MAKRLQPEFEDERDVLAFTDNTRWLEEIDARRSISPEELLTRLEDLLEQGELTHEQLKQIINDQ